MNKSLALLTLLCLGTASPATFAGNHGKGKFMNFFDANNDGTVTLDEFNESAKQRFTRIDSDGNASLTKEEFRAYIKSRRAERKQRRFAKIDTDNDGQLSKDEFIAFKMKKAERKFTRMDSDGDGVISAEEHVACKGGKHGKRKRRGGKIFQHMDANDDGNISQEESYAAWLNWFKRIDTNADNVVTAEEIQAHRQQRHKHRQ